VAPSIDDLMTANPPEPVVPVIRLMVVCNELVLGLPAPRTGVIDLADTRWSIEEPLTDVYIPQGMEGEFGVEELHVLAIVSGGLGEFDVQVQIFHQQLNEDGNIEERSSFRSRQVPIEFEAANRNMSQILDFHMKSVPFVDPGQYEFRLMAGKVPCVADGPTILRVLTNGDLMGEVKS